MINYYLVGGYVRDELLGVKSKDIDFAVEAESYEAMKKDLERREVFIYQERPEFFAIRGSHPKMGAVDFTLCRKDGFYSDNRRPDSVESGTIYDDLARRDFTVNAIAKSERTGLYLDPHNGQKDLKENLLRCVGNTKERFSEDPLRILRAMRFHIVRGFKLDTEIDDIFFTYPMLQKLKTVSIERIYEELVKCYNYDNYRTRHFLEETLLGNVIFDEIGVELIPRIRHVPR